MTKFTFSDVSEGFDKHIDDSIRGYNDLWRDILKISEYFVEDESRVYDLGCSTGLLLAEMQKQNMGFAPHAYYEGIELDPTYKTEWKTRENNYLKFSQHDVIEALLLNASLITSIFTLQFLSNKDRKDVIKDIFTYLNPGGAFIFAEKTRAESSLIQDIRTFTYYDFKHKKFSYDEIMEKERELRHMLKPNTYGELVHMCKEAGFEEVDSFWQNHGFVGFIAIKR